MFGEFRTLLFEPEKRKKKRKKECWFTCLFLYLLCWIKYVALAVFYSSRRIQMGLICLSAGRLRCITNLEENLPRSCIREECHNHPLRIPVQRLQCGVTSSGPSHRSSHLPPPRECRPSLQTFGDAMAEIGGGVEVKGGGLMSADTPAPSLGDNRASESKLSSVCTAGPREHRRRADLCPRIHMFSIKCFFLYLEHFQWSTVCRQKTNNFKEGRGQVTLFLNGGTNQICVSRPKIWMIICPSNRSVNPGWHARWGADELAV